MNNIKYMKYIFKHKYHVAKECFKLGMYWRGLTHDLSKFLPFEWNAYKNFFYGEYRAYSEFGAGIKYEFDCWSISKEGVKESFDYAWLNHIHKNKHHWQYWVLRYDDGSKIPLSMPDKYIKEMVCDWVGAGIAITGKREADKWYETNKDKMQLHDTTRVKVETLLKKLFK